MSIRTTIAAAALVTALLGAASTAVAATPSCGSQCINLYSNLYGAHWVLDSRNAGQVTGTPIVLAPASESNEGEDFTVDNEGSIEEFYEVGLVSAAIAAAYGSLSGVEIEYSPFGAPTGECVGVPVTPATGTPVTLQPCGISAKTVWIADSAQALAGTNVPLINAATNANYANPYVLTAAPSGQGLFTAPFVSLPFPFSLLFGPRLPSQLWNAGPGVFRVAP